MLLSAVALLPCAAAQTGAASTDGTLSGDATATDTAAFAETAVHLARTMHQLQASRPDPARHVRVLVYGQSISAQDWWKDVRRYLRATYPHAKLTVANKAVPGFAAGRLKHTVLQDVVPFAPDLVLFHDYGGHEDYEEIIRRLRRHTTAEVALMNDHLSARQDAAWHDPHSFAWLPALCRTYDLACIDVRGAWKRHLRENDLHPNALTRDGVHLNARGNALMAEVVTRYLRRAAALASSAPAPSGGDAVRTYRAGTDFAFDDDTARVAFSGRRVEVVPAATARAGAARVLIDGQPPSAFAGCWYATRPRVRAATRERWPAKLGLPITVDLGPPPAGEGWRAEDWTLMVTGVGEDPATTSRTVRFRLRGSETGPDGAGTSAAPFRSRSGKIAIRPDYWFQRQHEGDFSRLDYVQPGDEVTWSVRTMCQGAVRSGAGAPVTAAQGLPPGRHTLMLVRRGEAATATPPVEAVRVHRPLLHGEAAE